MNIDWTHFTPWASLTGGMILGVASAIFILVNGRILGISGILGGLHASQGWATPAGALLSCWACLRQPTVFHAVVPAEYITAPRIDADRA